MPEATLTQDQRWDDRAKSFDHFDEWQPQTFEELADYYEWSHERLKQAFTETKHLQNAEPYSNFAWSLATEEFAKHVRFILKKITDA